MASIVGFQHCTLSIELQVNGSSRLDVELEHFHHFIRDEFYAIAGKPSVSLTLPVGELQFSHTNIKAVSEVLDNPETRVVIGYAPAEQQPSPKDTHEYMITNYDMSYTSNRVMVTLFLVADLKEFMTKSTQKAYKNKTFVDVLKGLDSHIEIDTETGLKSDDSMIWIQNNVSDYQFIANSIKHCKASDKGDVILTAINGNKLRARSFKEAIQYKMTKKMVAFSTSSPKPSMIAKYRNVYNIGTIKVESSIGVYQYLLSVTSIPVLQVLDDETDEFSIFTIFSSPKAKAFQSDRIQSPKLDCGNTFKNYWETRLVNEKKIAEIYRNLLFIEVSGVNFCADTNLNLLDTVYLDATLDSQSESNSRVSSLTGNFVVFGISRYISTTGVVNRITLARDSSR